jgi:metallo-beta-lactamase class B
MKYIFQLSLLLAFATPVYVQAQHNSSPLSIEKIAPDFYVFTTYGELDDGSKYPANGMYIVTEQGVVLIDVPWDTTQTLPLLDTIQARHHTKVIASISTHFHKDRTAGLDVLKAHGVNTYASSKTVQLCKEKGEEIPEYVIQNDTIFHFGKHDIQTFYPGKGHSPDNIVVWMPDARILYGGCFVKSMESGNLGNLSDAHPDEWVASVKKVQSKFKSVNCIVPGHGSWKSKQSLNHTLKLAQDYNKKK